MKSKKANVNVTQFSLWTNQKKRRHASSSHIQQSYFLNKNSWKQYLQYRPILILSQSHMLEPKAGEISHQYNFFELDYGEKESINKWINYKYEIHSLFSNQLIFTNQLKWETYNAVWILDQLPHSLLRIFSFSVANAPKIRIKIWKTSMKNFEVIQWKFNMGDLDEEHFNTSVIMFLSKRKEELILFRSIHQNHMHAMQMPNYITPLSIIQFEIIFQHFFPLVWRGNLDSLFNGILINFLLVKKEIYKPHVD